MADQTTTYFEAVRQGPFSGVVDLWAEDTHYFHQLHGSMIGFMVEQMQPALFALGYQAGREASLQIIENRFPDVYIRHQEDQPSPLPTSWDYGAAAVAIAAEPSVTTDVDVPQVDAVFIYDNATSDLVTVIELVSPSNKDDSDALNTYRRRRDDILSKGVNVVEIDITRSKRHLLSDARTFSFPYHYAIYLPGQKSGYISGQVLTPLKRLAVPLRQQVVPLEPQPNYDAAYRQVLLAGHILRETDYQPEHLPQPGLLTPGQRAQALEQVAAWKTQLQAAR
jgi:hypothetical protein